MNYRGGSIDFNLLKVFVVAYQEKNFKRAAQSLSYTAPAVSIKLSHLKRQIGGELFIKTPSGVEPTPLADELFQKVSPLVFELESSIRELGQFSPDSIQQSIRIDMGQHFQPWLCPSLFNEFRTHNQEVEIHFHQFSEQSIDRLRNNEVDVCIQYVSKTSLEKDIIEIPIGHDQMGMLASIHHPHKGASGKLDELLNYGMAMLKPGLPEKGKGPLMLTIKELNLPLSISCTAPSMDCISDIIEQSTLITPCSKRTADRYNTKLRYIDVEDFPELSQHAVSVYIHQRNRHSKLHQWLVEILKQQFTR